MPESSSHGIAPGRTSRGVAPVTSTIVDGGRRASARVEQQIDAARPASRSTSSGSAVAGSPLTFALVAVSGRPHARADRARDRVRRHAHADASGPAGDVGRRCAGGRAASSVSGPGQNRAASRAPSRRQRAELRRDLRDVGGDRAAARGRPPVP